MPVIDLKNVNIYFEDGTSMVGNLTANGTLGDSTITVNNFVGEIVPVGARLSIGGNDTYQVTASGVISGNTANITFTPTLMGNVANLAAVTVFGVFIEIKVGDGTLTWSEKKPREYKLNRGRIDSVRNGDEVPMDVSINLMYEAVTASSGDPPTPEDAVKQRGEAADWVTTEAADPCAPFCINIRLDHLPPGCTDFDKERVILPFFRYEEIQHDPKAGTMNMTGKCNATQATVTRISA